MVIREPWQVADFATPGGAVLIGGVTSDFRPRPKRRSWTPKGKGKLGFLLQVSTRL